MIIKSDWHIHSCASYDATLQLETIAENAESFGFKKTGITDHLNFNDVSFINNIKDSAANVKEFQKTNKNVVLGVELTPISKPLLDYIAKTGTRDGFEAPMTDELYPIELSMTKEELKSYGIRYAVGASHWRVDGPKAKETTNNVEGYIREWYRQQLWLACDDRVTILGHPWYNGRGLWYEDFNLIPRSMNMEIAAALKENKKYVECNGGLLTSSKMNEKYRVQYIEFLRELFEMGIPITYGSDSHHDYTDKHIFIEKYLSDVGFKEGDFSELKEEDLW